VALGLATRRLLEEQKISSNPLLHNVAAVSVGIVNGQALLDLCYEEDVAAAVDMNLVMTETGDFVELQGTGEESTFSADDLSQMLALGRIGMAELFAAQKSALAPPLPT
jgi:ribonuclease PH